MNELRENFLSLPGDCLLVMMQTLKTDKLHPQHVTDTTGRQTAVILPLGEYKELLEDLDE